MVRQGGERNGMAEIFWRAGAVDSQKYNASEVYAELQRILQRDGRLYPDTVVREAESMDSPLHLLLEWDETEAAHQYRLNQARRMIRGIHIRRDPDSPIEPAFVNIRIQTDEGSVRYYQDARVVVQSDSEFTAAVEVLTAKLVAAQMALDALKGMIGRRDARRQRLSAVTEALITARELAKALL